MPGRNIPLLYLRQAASTPPSRSLFETVGASTVLDTSCGFPTLTIGTRRIVPGTLRSGAVANRDAFVSGWLSGQLSTDPVQFLESDFPVTLSVVAQGYTVSPVAAPVVDIFALHPGGQVKIGGGQVGTPQLVSAVGSGTSFSETITISTALLPAQTRIALAFHITVTVAGTGALGQDPHLILVHETAVSRVDPPGYAIRPRRSVTPAVPAPSAVQSRLVSTNRTVSTAPLAPAASPRRVISASRSIAPAVPAPAVQLSRSAVFPRLARADMPVPASDVRRLAAFVRNLESEIPAPVAISRRAIITQRPVTPELVAPRAVVTRLFTAGRAVTGYLAAPPDDANAGTGREISGTVRNRDGSPNLEGHEVQLFNTITGRRVAVQHASSVDGSYVFTRSELDNGVYFVAVWDDEDSVAAVSDRDVVSQRVV